jgi:hypothetical protein
VKFEEQEIRNTHRRLVTGNVNEKSVVQNDERLFAYAFATVSGYGHTLFWVNPAAPDLKKELKFDRYPDSVVLGTRRYQSSLCDLPGLADHFEKEDPAMHKTNTVDYAVVFEGEIWLELDDGNTVHLEHQVARNTPRLKGPRSCKRSHHHVCSNSMDPT